MSLTTRGPFTAIATDLSSFRFPSVHAGRPHADVDAFMAQEDVEHNVGEISCELAQPRGLLDLVLIILLILWLTGNLGGGPMMR